MIERTKKGIDDTEYTELIPETEEDLERLRKIDNLDDRHSMADDPDRLTEVDVEAPEDRDLGPINPS